MKITQQYAESIRQPLDGRGKDYTGQVNGKLTMLYPTTERISGAGVKWVAQCKCGSLSLCVPSNKGATSCGCAKSEASKNTILKTRAKLTDDQVRLIRLSDDKCIVLAAIYGVNHCTISSVRTGRRYSHVV
jgi:hypothetical protein